MEFSPWVLATDLGLAFLLLLVGKLLRAWVKPIQVLFLPAAIIAGLLGLALGPNGFNILPFSNQIGAYPWRPDSRALRWSGARTEFQSPGHRRPNRGSCLLLDSYVRHDVGRWSSVCLTYPQPDLGSAPGFRDHVG